MSPSPRFRAARAFPGVGRQSLKVIRQDRLIVTFLIPLALIGWVPLCLALFATLPRQTAVVVAVVGAWIFLPPTAIVISNMPNFGKPTAFAYGVLLGTLLFMPDRILRFRPHWLDLPVLCYCVAPFLSSMTNGLGPYDGASAVFSVIATWGLPYLTGRIHFNGERNLRDLMVGMAAGCVVLIPFCLFEMRMSPVLLPNVYGFGKFMGMRLGGWRPRVFFLDGLELGMWMAGGLLIAVWLWFSGSFDRLAGWSVGRVVLPALTVVTLLCRSTGALALLIVGLAVLWLCRQLNSRLGMILLLSASLFYVGIRVTNVWDYSGLISFLRANFDPSRAQSLEFRFENEDILIEKAVRRPTFGWGGWGRARVYSDSGRDISITDGLWIIIMGNNGAFGLGSFLASFLLPSFLFTWRYKPREWATPIAGAQAATVCAIAIYMIDCLLNAFPNAVFTVALGGLVSSLQLGRDDSLQDHGESSGTLRDRLATPPPTQDDSTEARLADRYIELARNSRRAGADAEAAEAWRHAMELLESGCANAPEDRELARRRLDCANDMAWFLANRPDPASGDRDEAASLARRATEAEPEEAAYWNTLAIALCRVGDDFGALEAAERSMELADVSTGFDFVALALAHARIGRKDEARRWLDATREWRKLNRTDRSTLDALIRETEAALGP